VLCDTAIADGMRTGLIPPAKGADDASWNLRAETWRDSRVILGASDTGAHVQSMATFDWAVDFLYENRRRQLITLEEAVRKVTEIPASLYGLRDRGVVREGAYADVLVFNFEELAPGPIRTREDLPGGASRLYGVPVGLRHVFVNGHEAVREGAISDLRQGRVLRSGADTVTVGVTASHRS
jgi:N-acyl-D-aspartate/D-glutamate deacylase